MTKTVAQHSTSLDDDPLMQEKRVKRHVAFLLGFIGIAVVLASVFIFRLAQGTMTREVTQWRVYLDALVESRGQAIEDWLGQEVAAARGIADNTAVRLYLTEIADGQADAAIEAQKSYLGNLIAVTAERWGLTPRGTNVPANVENNDFKGLALLDGDGAVIASIGKLPALSNQDLQFLPLDGQVKGPLMINGAPVVLRALIPIFAVQADPDENAMVGYLYVVRPFQESMTPLLRQPGTPAAQISTALVDEGADHLRLVHTVDEGAFSGTNLPYETLDNGFLSLTRGDGNRSLALLSPVEGLGLAAMVAVPEDAILGPVLARRNVMIIGLGLALVVAVVAILLVWRHGVSLRLAQAHRKEQAMVRDLGEARDLLRLVADEQPTAILVLDGQDHIQFANKSVLKLSGMKEEDTTALHGKSAAAVLGSAVAQSFTKLADTVRQKGRSATSAVTLDYGAGPRKGHLDAIAIHGAHLGGGAVLLVWDDLTDLIDAREKREHSLEQLLEVLVGLIDARDPYSAAHSRRVSHLADRVATVLGYGEEDRRVVKIAGMVMNLGKVLVPRDILTKPGQLTKEEMDQVRSAIAHTSGLLSSVDFDAPVLPILEALQREDVDAVPTPAALLRVLNDFISMVSPRAHREAMSVDKALAILRENADAYDHSNVSALAHVMDNLDGRDDVARWQDDTPATPPPAL